MALARVHVWAEGEILTAADLNSEFNNLINNPISIVSPLVGNLDVNFNSLVNVANITNSANNLGISVGGITSMTIATTLNTLQTLIQVESDHVSDGAAFTFFHNANPIDGQTTGVINWVGKSGGVAYSVAAHSVIRSACEDASAMYSIQVFTTQAAANQTDANTSASLTAVGVWTDASGAAIKRYVDEPMDGVLDKFKGLNTLGVYVGKRAPIDSERHYSPTAEEFYDIFGLGNNPSDNPELAGIAPKDVSWLAVKAIMELEQRVACLEVK